jgi:hypothetical protein
LPRSDRSNQNATLEILESSIGENLPQQSTLPNLICPIHSLIKSSPSIRSFACDFHLWLEDFYLVLGMSTAEITVWTEFQVPHGEEPNITEWNQLFQPLVQAAGHVESVWARILERPDIVLLASCKYRPSASTSAPI